MTQDEGTNCVVCMCVCVCLSQSMEFQHPVQCRMKDPREEVKVNTMKQVGCVCVCVYVCFLSMHTHNVIMVLLNVIYRSREDNERAYVSHL